MAEISIVSASASGVASNFGVLREGIDIVGRFIVGLDGGLSGVDIGGGGVRRMGGADVVEGPRKRDVM